MQTIISNDFLHKNAKVEIKYGDIFRKRSCILRFYTTFYAF